MVKERCCIHAEGVKATTRLAKPAPSLNVHRPQANWKCSKTVSQTLNAPLLCWSRRRFDRWQNSQPLSLLGPSPHGPVDAASFITVGRGSDLRVALACPSACTVFILTVRGDPTAAAAAGLAVVGTARVVAGEGLGTAAGIALCAGQSSACPASLHVLWAHGGES